MYCTRYCRARDEGRADGGWRYKWMPSRKAGETSRVSARFSMSMENEQAGGVKDGQTCLATPNSQGLLTHHGDGEKCIFLVQLTTGRIWQPYPA